MEEKKPPVLLALPAELCGERVLVRPLRPGDGEALWEAVEESREHLRPWLPWESQHGVPEDSETFVRKAHAWWLLRQDMPLSVWERNTGRFLGGTGLHPRDWDVPWFEIGYWLRCSAEGQGFMTEAVRLVCRLAFEALGAQRVHIQCDVRNVRSAAIPRRLGFVHEATLRNHTRDPAGDLRDTLIFAMTPADYASTRGGEK